MHLYRLLLVLCGTLLCLSLSYAQVTTRYVYDANGRLRAVVTPEGAALYEYDPAGNFTRIRRLLPTDCEVLELAPRQGAYGALVTLYGIGFAQASAVTFNGKAAEIITKTATTVVVKVPVGAESGPVAITLPCGTKTLPTRFTVSGVSVTPATIAVSPRRTVQFLAQVAGLTDTSVKWAVNGIEGGNASVGTITESGLYTAPSQAPNATTVYLIRATSVLDPSLFGEAQAKVVGSGYEFLAQGVSVRYGTPPNVIVAAARATVAVGYAPATPPTASVISLSLVSVTRAAAVTSISTPRLERGATTTLRLQGTNLQAIQAVHWVREDGTVEPELRIALLQPNEEGTALQVNVTVSRQAAPGRRFLRLTMADGTTTAPAPAVEILP